MGLTVKKWLPEGNEGKLLKHLSEQYQDVSRDVYLLHDVLLATKGGIRFRPDFILIDPEHGIAIIEEKSYLEENLREIDSERVYFKDGNSDVNPIRKGEDYTHNLQNVLRAEGINVPSKSITCHVVFSNLPEEKLDLLPSHFVQKHYRNYKTTLSLKTLFSESTFMGNQAPKISHLLSPVLSFSNSSIELSSHRDSIAALDEKQVSVVLQNPYGHYLVSGIPGSGKSVVVVSRALYLQELHPEWKILILSVNEKLRVKNEDQVKSRLKLHKSLQLQDGISCQTLMGFLKRESAITTQNRDYTGQLKAYVQHLKSKSITPKWDAILIDEYQDFEDEVLEQVMRFGRKMGMTINKKTVIRENLFLVGDKLQQIWEKGCSHSWKSLGIHIAGRTTNLKTSYRCAKEGLTLGLNLLKSSRAGLRSQVEDFYEGTNDIDFLLSSNFPITFSEASWQEADFELKRWILKLVSDGARYSDIMIIVPDNKKTLDELSMKFGKEIQNGLVIGMPSTIKGLEAPFCAIYNLDYIKPLKWHSEEVRLRTIYMCLTRASYGVFVNSFNPADEIYTKLLEINNSKAESSGLGKLRKLFFG